MGIADYSFYTVIKANGVIHRDRPALICGPETVSHGRFLERVDRLACGLLDAGLKKGDRIAVLAKNSLEFMYLYGACARTGAIMLPINWRLKPEEIEFILADGAPKFLFADADLQEVVSGPTVKLPFVEKRYSLAGAEEAFAAFEGLMRSDRPCPPVEVSPDDPFVIMHTAAVGGRPRGATLSHRALIFASMQALLPLQISPDDRHLCALPLFHVTALDFCLMMIVAGAASVLLPKFDADLCLKCIQDEKITLFAEFPPMLSTLLDRNEKLKCDLSSLKNVFGLETPDTIKRFEEQTASTFWFGYGQTEVSAAVTLAPFRERPGAAGRPLSFTELDIVDEYGRFLEPGNVGEIVVRGPVVFNGYWNLEEDTRYTMRDGWLHTGDQGRVDDAGYLWYAGRMPEKELIKPGGENVYPMEVEKAILEHALVEEVVVLGVPDAQWGEAIKAVCTLKQGESLSPAELTEFVASRIARYKKPKHVVFVTQLPKKPDGSIDRQAVKAKYGTP